MKRTKKLYMMLGILVVVCIAAFAVTKFEEKQEEIKNSDEVILELDADSVTALSWEYNSKILSFHKDEVWTYDEDEAFPVDEEKIGDLLGVFESFGVSFIIEEVEDFSQYGLDDPKCAITIETEDETYEIALGDYSTMDSERYVSIGDGNVYLVGNDPLEYFDAELSDVIKHDELPDFEEVTKITFAGAEEYEVTYEEDSKNTYCAEDVYFVEKEGNTLPLDTTNVDVYLEKISSLGLTNYVTYNATEEKIADCGLAEPELTVTVEYTADDTSEEVVLRIGCDEDETAYVRVGESQIIYEITEEEYDHLMAASYDDLRHEEVLSADFADIQKIEISLDGEEYTITVKDGTYFYGEAEIEIETFQTALEALVADSFTEEEPTEKEEISLTVSLDNENYPEVEITLYRYDGSYCLAEVDGESMALVERSLVVDLIEAVNAIVLN